MRAVRSGILVGLGALALSGCAVFDGTPTAAQQKTIGKVAITFKVCASQSSGTPSGSCTNQGNSHENASNSPGASPTDTPSQLWIAFRVPTGTVTPRSFTSSSTGPNDTGPQLTFTPSSTYAGELERTEPAAVGQEWVGYVSQYVSYSSTTGEQNFTATADFGLPTAKDGAPFAGPFNYQLVVGGRQYIAEGSTTAPSADEAVDCQNTATNYYSTFINEDSSYYNWICIDDSSPSTVGANATLPTRDAGIVPGKTVRVTAGKKAAAHFTFEYSGSSPGATFTLSARTTVRRTKATPKPKSITPSGTSNTPVTVTVPVPANAKAGTYKVKLTAKLPDGESRSGTVKVVVKAARKAKTARKKTTSPKFTG